MGYLFDEHKIKEGVREGGREGGKEGREGNRSDGGRCKLATDAPPTGKVCYHAHDS